MQKQGRNVERIHHFLMATGLFVLMAVSLEVILGFFHLERYDREFSTRSAFPLFVPGEGSSSGHYETNIHFKAALNYQRFRLRKGNGVFRVFVLGGSAAFGWPGEEPDSFTGYLRRAFDRAAPGRFEIVNVAGMSYGSHRVLDLLKDVVLFEPDLVVVYCGNNEYVERNALSPGEREGGLAYRVRNLVSRMNVYRAIRFAISKGLGPGKFLDGSSREPDMTDLRSNPGVARATRPRNPAVDELVFGNYRRNLLEMTRILGERSIPFVFSSIPVNLDSWQPSEPSLRFKDRKELLWWVSKAREAKELLRRDPERADIIFGELLARKPEWAPGAYYRGKALEERGEYAAALGMFGVARDRDSRPMRAFGSFNEAIREVATGARGGAFLDLEGLFRQRSAHGITGDALVRDYCHPTEAGHKLIASALAPIVLRAGGMEGILPIVEDAIAKDAYAPTKPPVLRASERYATGMTLFFNGKPGEAEKVFLEVLTLDPGHLGAVNNLGLIYLEKGQLPKARDLFHRALSMDPGHIHAQYNLGLLQLREGDLAEAEKSMRKVLSLNPEYPKALLHLGDIAMRKDAYRDALEFYRKALSMGSEDSRLHLMMGKAHLALGDEARAVPELEKALEFDPADEEAAKLLEAVH